jgi:hypothetical protein
MVICETGFGISRRCFPSPISLRPLIEIIYRFAYEDIHSPARLMTSAPKNAAGRFDHKTRHYLETSISMAALITRVNGQASGD